MAIARASWFFLFHTSSADAAFSLSAPLWRHPRCKIFRIEVSPRFHTRCAVSADDAKVFQDDLARVQSLRPTDDTASTRLVSPGSTYTKTWDLSQWDRHCAAPLGRYLRHVLSWPSSKTAQRALPTATAVALWASGVSVLASHSPSAARFLESSSLSSGVLGTFLSPIALLLTLRTNAALSRLLEARAAWGRAVLAARSLMSLVVSYLIDRDKLRAMLVGKYLAVFGWSFKAMFRKEDDEDVIRAVLPSEEAEWLLSQPTKRPVAILGRIRQLSAEAAGCDEGTEMMMPTAAQIQILERIYDLESCVGICERILGSPIPPTYTRHTSRVLTLYLLLLPLALAGLGLPPVALVTTSAAISYVLVGIDEIGVEIEHPFPLLPMQNLAAALQADVATQVKIGSNMPRSSVQWGSEAHADTRVQRNQTMLSTLQGGNAAFFAVVLCRLLLLQRRL